MPVKTIAYENNEVILVDQTLLPNEFKYITIDTIETMWEAIKKLRVRGAPAIGVAAAFGIYIGIRDFEGEDKSAFVEAVNKSADYIATSRPTAVNLFWAVDRIKKLAAANQDKSVAEQKELILKESIYMIKEDDDVCKAIGRNGAALLPDEVTILTHCNAGGLATASYGTAVGVIFSANEMGKKIKVYADETRPLLQGARLTAWELVQEGIDCTLICDNMAAVVMKKGLVDAIVVGADRIAANGDAANKIGTYTLSVLAKEHGVDFYIAAPLSTIDMSLESGDEIPIEERDPDEVRCFGGNYTAPKNVKVFNPAFDVTPNANIKGIITEKGVVSAPYVEGLRKLFGK